jgi:hypothetical protein
MEEILIGQVTHYYTRICVAAVVLEDTLRAGDIVRIRGKHTDFVQRATSMEIQHQPVLQAEAGHDIGLLVDHRARAGDRVYKLTGVGAEALLPHSVVDLRDWNLER